MKKRISLWLLGLFTSITMLMAQDIPVGVVVAFKKGNSQELNKFLGEKVDLIIQNKSTHVDRQVAENAISDFFANNKVKGFNVNHQGKRNESSFVVGTLATANGNFRVNCFFRRVSNKYIINQIRIDRTDE